MRKIEEISKLNTMYSNQSITIKIYRRYYKQSPLREETYIINNILFREPDVFDHERRNGSLIVSLKGKTKKEIEISKENVYLIEEFTHPTHISGFDETLETIINFYRNL